MAIERILDRYDILRRLGSGGMGDVWEAYDDLLGRSVAIKFVGERELRESPGAHAILRDEAKNAGKLLGNPQVVSVLDLVDVKTDLHEGPAVVLEYVQGCNLAEWIESWRGKLDPFTQLQTGLYISMQIIEAVHAAHRVKILHRDIKPQNVLCSTEGWIKVSDFGLSRVVEEITRTHTVWGRHTPLYAAPEQWQDEKPDEKTDIYQLAATLYHLLSGQPANRGRSLIGLLRWHDTGSLQPLQDLVPNLDASVCSIIEEGLAKDREVRPDLWRIFDAASAALARTGLRLQIDIPSGDEALIERIADLTDFSIEELTKNRKGGYTMPHANEAIQECIGVTIVGGTCRLSPPPV